MKLLVIVGLLIGTNALACRSDYDCGRGASCVKDGFRTYGVCVGGNNPGNRYDKNQMPYRSNERLGNTCRHKTDCGSGLECVKQGYDSVGVCTK